jgi:hypothetical protein
MGTVISTRCDDLTRQLETTVNYSILVDRNE